MAEKKQVAETKAVEEKVSKADYDTLVSALNDTAAQANKVSKAFNKLLDRYMADKRNEIINSILNEIRDEEAAAKK